MLVAEADDALFVQCLSDFSGALGVERLRLIDVEGLGAERTRCRAHLKTACLA
jgi:hypothetical protein